MTARISRGMGDITTINSNHYGKTMDPASVCGLCTENNLWLISRTSQSTFSTCDQKAAHARALTGTVYLKHPRDLGCNLL